MTKTLDDDDGFYSKVDPDQPLFFDPDDPNVPDPPEDPRNVELARLQALATVSTIEASDLDVYQEPYPGQDRFFEEPPEHVSVPPAMDSWPAGEAKKEEDDLNELWDKDDARRAKILNEIED